MAHGKALVIVTGASGFVGNAVIEKARRCSTTWSASTGRCRRIHRQPPSASASTSRPIASVAAALERVRTAHGETIASVVHLAAYFDETGEPDPRYESVTVEGTRPPARRRSKAFDVEQFVFVSTMLVHAPSGHDRRRSTRTRRSTSAFPYRASKIRARRRCCVSIAASVPLVVLRPAGVYDDRCHNVFLAHQVARIYERRLTSHVYPGDLLAGEPYLHLRRPDRCGAAHRRSPPPTCRPETALLLAETDVMSLRRDPASGRPAGARRGVGDANDPEDARQHRCVAAGQGARRRPVHPPLHGRDVERPLRGRYRPRRGRLLEWQPASHRLRDDACRR